MFPKKLKLLSIICNQTLSIYRIFSNLEPIFHLYNFSDDPSAGDRFLVGNFNKYPKQLEVKNAL
jgi:hypothetical protein